VAAERPTGGMIYGVSLRAEFDYRYVGLTTKSIEIRLKQHFKVARSGRKTPFYDWLRARDCNDVIADKLDLVDGLEELGWAEIDWIGLLRGRGTRCSICLKVRNAGSCQDSIDRPQRCR
jgi:hypothetical protein